MKILGNILTGLVITLLLAVGGLLLVSLMPIPGNVEVKIVKSGSMEPAIPTGSLVVVVPRESYAVGDVVTFGRDTAREIPTTHRITEVRLESTNTFYTTKGDANEEADPQEVSAGEVIGKVFFHVPGLGYVLDFARQPLGFALLIGLPAAMIVVEETFNIAKEIAAIRRRRNDKTETKRAVREPARKTAALRTRVPTI